MKKLIIGFRKLCKLSWGWFVGYWRRNLWHKLVVIACALLLLVLGVMYGVARWYMAYESNKPEVMGVSFIPAYAESLGVNPEKTMDALIKDLGVRHFRLVSYWDRIEPTKGSYDFKELDWQFKKAEAAHAKITLSIGLRQPRWPECHIPDWAKQAGVSKSQPELQGFIAAVVDRYKKSPALDSYQLENEALLKSFGECTDFSRDRLVAEYKLVKEHDAKHPVIMSRSNNLPSMPAGQPRPDEFGFSIYRRVWDSAYTHRYVEYPFPSWYYASLAGFQKILTGRDSMIHELQAEAWPPNGQGISKISLEEQNKSFDAKRFKDVVAFGRATGMKEMYLWGAEYWYYRLTVEHDSSVWTVARETFQNQQ